LISHGKFLFVSSILTNLRMLLNEPEFKEISNGLYDLLNLEALRVNLERSLFFFKFRVYLLAFVVRNEINLAEELFVALSTLKNLKNVNLILAKSKKLKKKTIF